MLILQERQVCPHSNNCPYNINDSCQGSNPRRMCEFKCAYVVGGIISEKKQIRNPMDQTGGMKVIME